MEFCHRDIDLHSVAAQRLAEFMDKRRQKWATQADASCVDNFESFEHELHSLMMAIERELVSEELGRYKVTVEEIEVDGKAYGRGISLPETYLTSAGRVTIERHLYNPADPKDKSICPMELRSGIIAGYFTPQAARQGAFVMAHLTPGESEEMFGEIGSNVDFENDIFPRQLICNGVLSSLFGFS
jgi:hypothetical protein